MVSFIIYMLHLCLNHIREKCDGLCMNYYIVIFKIYSHTINNFIIKFKVKIKIISLHLHYESQDMF